MDVLVTGSHGLIGSALIPRLRADGHRVARLVRGAPEGGDDVRWDPHAGTVDAAGLDGIDAVVHLAGAGIGDKKWTPDRKRLILESRTEGTSLLARTLAGLDRKPSVLLSGSAVGIYGDRGVSCSRRRAHRAPASLPMSAPRGRRPPPPPRRPGSGWRTCGPASSSRPMAARSGACCPRSSSASAAGWGRDRST